MKNKQKGFVAQALVVLIAIIVIGGGLYYGTQKKNNEVNNIEINTEASVSGIDENVPIQTTVQKAPTNNTVESPVVSIPNWKTYTDTKYGFSFQYPQYLGDVVVTKSNLTDCPMMKSYSRFGTIEGKNMMLTFTNKAIVGSGGSYMEYYIPVALANLNDTLVCGFNLYDLKGNVLNDSRNIFSVFNQKNKIQAYKSTLGTSIGTSADIFYTLYETLKVNIFVVQPKAIFIPYANTNEWAEIDTGEKAGDRMAIVNFIQKSPNGEQIRKYLADFEQMVQSMKFYTGETIKE